MCSACLLKPSHSEDPNRVSREDSSLLRKEHQFDSIHRIEMFTGTTARQRAVDTGMTHSSHY